MALPKLPWSKTDTDDGETIEFSDGNGEELFYISCWDGEDGRGRYNEFDEAVAELIIRGCNNHHKLVVMLGSVLDELDKGGANCYNCDPRVFAEARALHTQIGDKQ